MDDTFARPSLGGNSVSFASSIGGRGDTSAVEDEYDERLPSDFPLARLRNPLPSEAAGVGMSMSASNSLPAAAATTASSQKKYGEGDGKDTWWLPQKQLVPTSLDLAADDDDSMGGGRGGSAAVDASGMGPYGARLGVHSRLAASAPGASSSGGGGGGGGGGGRGASGARAPAAEGADRVLDRAAQMTAALPICHASANPPRRAAAAQLAPGGRHAPVHSEHSGKYVPSKHSLRFHKKKTMQKRFEQETLRLLGNVSLSGQVKADIGAKLLELQQELDESEKAPMGPNGSAIAAASLSSPTGGGGGGSSMRLGGLLSAPSAPALSGADVAQWSGLNAAPSAPALLPGQQGGGRGVELGVGRPRPARRDGPSAHQQQQQQEQEEEDSHNCIIDLSAVHPPLPGQRQILGTAAVQRARSLLSESFGTTQMPATVAASEREAEQGDDSLCWELNEVQFCYTLHVAAEANCVEYSPGGDVLAVGHDHGVTLWASGDDGDHDDDGDGMCSSVTTIKAGCTTGLRWSPDGTRLAAGCFDDCQVHVWGAVGRGSGTLFRRCEGELLDQSFGHSDWVRAVAWSPDGTMLASAANDAKVKIWDMSGHGGGKPALRFRHDGALKAVDWCAGGDAFGLVAAGDAAGVVKIYDPRLPTTVASLQQNGAVSSVQVGGSRARRDGGGSSERKLFAARGTQLCG